MRVSVVAVVAVVTVDRLDVGDKTAVIVENEPLVAELFVGTELDTAVFPEVDTADDDPVVDPDEGGGPVPARMRIPTLMVLAAPSMPFCADRR
jgi:hypothetical protein